jgi:hypothetical protein
MGCRPTARDESGSLLKRKGLWLVNEVCSTHLDEIHLRSIKYTVSFVFLDTICSYTECNRLTSIQPRQYMYPSIFASTRSYKDGHKMVFSWMCQSKAFVLSECDKRGLPCVGLQAGLSTENVWSGFLKRTHIGNRESRSHGIVELMIG